MEKYIVVTNPHAKIKRSWLNWEIWNVLYIIYHFVSPVKTFAFLLAAVFGLVTSMSLAMHLSSLHIIKPVVSITVNVNRFHRFNSINFNPGNISISFECFWKQPVRVQSSIASDISLIKSSELKAMSSKKEASFAGITLSSFCYFLPLCGFVKKQSECWEKEQCNIMPCNTIYTHRARRMSFFP
jgi:hypothetical protein